MKFIQKKESSETIRKTTFIIKNFNYCKPKQISIKKDLFEWIIGFLELFFVEKQKKKLFLINYTDIIPLTILRKVLGIGKIKTININSFLFQININQYFLLVLLFQNNFQLLLTPYYLFFNSSNYNNQNLLKITKINYLNNFWLAGLIDVRGQFFIQKKKKNVLEFDLYFGLDLPNNKSLERYLICLLSQNNYIIKKNNFYIKKNFINLLHYLNQYPLKTKKKILFYQWLKLKRYKEMMLNQTLSIKTKKRIIKLIKKLVKVEDRVH